jgi:hypothetical protein
LIRERKESFCHIAFVHDLAAFIPASQRER